MTTTFIIVPGYTNSGPEHWQSFLERKYANVIRVIQDNWDSPNHHLWVKRLNETIENTIGDIILIGHSCGAVTVAQWAACSENRRVKAAILVAPADVDSELALDELHQQRPLSTEKLSIPSLLICSDNDEHLSYTRAHELASKWGSEIIVIEGGGHLHTAAGYGEWLEGENLIINFTGQQFIKDEMWC
nr:alpha/beta hydrolase [Providencia burhodogranariea]